MNNYFYKNLYEILGIEPTDDLAQIKSAYRTLARKYHPDLNGGNELYVSKFKEVTEACEILMDKDKKAFYDAFRGYNQPKNNANYKKVDPQKAHRAYKSTKKEQSSTPNSENASTQPKGSFSQVLNEILDGLFKEQHSTSAKTTNKSQKKNTKRKAVNGEDVTTELEITYLEALNGTHRTVNILHTEICPNCQGKMFINGAQCPLCKGLGETSVHKKINVKVPAKIKQNAKIRLSGEGNRGRNGGKNGDVYLIIKIKNDEKYTYDGLNVGFEASIYPHEAVFGTELRVETPQGTIKMKIPANCAQGQKFRLSAHGLKDETGKIGDAIVTVRIDIPENLTEEELQLYKKLSEICNNRVKNESIK